MPPVPSDSRALLDAELAGAQTAASEDPFVNPYLLFALHLTDALQDGRLDLDRLEAVVRDLTTDAFYARAERLRAYLDAPDPDADVRRLRALFERLAEGGFEAYARTLARPALGIVTTAHPTFALKESLSETLVELAAGRAADGAPLDDVDRHARLALAHDETHAAPYPLTLDVEHAWSIRALGNAADALVTARRMALQVARQRWPDRWTGLEPRLMTLATWVGFDQDGRTDITWDVSVEKRLQLKRIALQRRLDEADALDLTRSVERLRRAKDLVERQIELMAGLPESGPEAVATLSRALVADREEALCDPAPLLDDIEAALAAGDGGDERRERLVALRGVLKTQGVGLAHIHVRLNAGQLHNAIRREVALETSPTDPANRRSYFNAVGELIGRCRPTAVSFASLLDEPTSARRLFITIAQMTKFIDAVSPVRFLIAETESGFTLLAALYFARLFGVEEVVEISPLFETEEAFHRGETVIEEALRSPHYREYLRRHGRIAVQFGFSDSGRYIGQMAATFRIERLRLRIAELLQRESLTDLEIVLFNTHGESIGRGGHPGSLQDRLSYAAPSRSRAEFAERGIAVREEDSFQGGDGFLPFFTPAAALASVRGCLAWALTPALQAPEAADPIYDAPGYAAEFFATVEQAFLELAHHPDYPALLGLYGTRLLLKTGSRPERRTQEGGGATPTFTRVSELRAIPNNGILQGLAQLANTTFGVSRAAAKDPQRFEDMRARSPRFRRALAMADAAHDLGDLPATRAYAASVNPSLWLDRRAAGLDDRAVETLADLCEGVGLTGRLSRVLRRIRAEPRYPAAEDSLVEPERRRRIQLLHGVRIGLIQQVALLAERLPLFAPRLDVDREGLRLQLLRLEIPRVVDKLRLLFPVATGHAGDSLDFGETAAYGREGHEGYAREEAELIEPLARIHRLLLATTAALDHEIGACG